MQTDDEGLLPESLEETLKNNDIKFIYLVPTFQNPTGRTLGEERRKQTLQIRPSGAVSFCNLATPKRQVGKQNRADQQRDKKIALP